MNNQVRPFSWIEWRQRCALRDWAEAAAALGISARQLQRYRAASAVPVTTLLACIGVEYTICGRLATAAAPERLGLLGDGSPLRAMRRRWLGLELPLPDQGKRASRNRVVPAAAAKPPTPSRTGQGQYG